MNERPADKLAIAVAQLNPIVGDVSGNPSGPARRARKPPRDGADLIAFPELFIAGYPPEDLVLKPAFQAACRAAVEALARETADGGPACSSARPGSRTASSTTPMRSSTAAASRRSASRSICRITACSTRSACSRRGRCRARSAFNGVRSACRSARTSGARRGRVPGRDRRRDPAGAERLALLARQADVRLNIAVAASPSPACRSSISTRSAARTSSSSTARPSRSTPTARSRSSFRPSVKRW